VRKIVTSSRKKYFREVAEAELAEEEPPPRLRDRPISITTRLDLFFLSLLLIAAAVGLFVLLSIFLYGVIIRAVSFG
jgi:hypothetical protein